MDNGTRAITGIRSCGILGGALASTRRAKGMTQVDLAEASGISRSQISKIESGTEWPRAATVMRLLRALECSFTLVPDDPAAFSLEKHLARYEES